MEVASFSGRRFPYFDYDWTVGWSYCRFSLFSEENVYV